YPLPTLFLLSFPPTFVWCPVASFLIDVYELLFYTFESTITLEGLCRVVSIPVKKRSIFWLGCKPTAVISSSPLPRKAYRNARSIHGVADFTRKISDGRD